MVIIVGCGVIGLSCGILLQEAGQTVKILARELPPFTTSNIAAAVWYPYKAYPIEKVLAWSQTSYERFCGLMTVPEAGVRMVTLLEVYRHAPPDIWWKEAVQNFRPMTADELPKGYESGFSFDVPLIETPLYMNYLVQRFLAAGGEIQQKDIEHLNQLDASLIFNCAGLGARELVKDSAVYPIRGQILRTSLPTEHHAWMEESDVERPIYIFPRSQDCVIGGTVQENDWSLEVDPAISQTMLTKAQTLVPSLHNVQILGQLVGLRPGRASVRLERETLPTGQIVIHNYGHGGAGFTLAWGCAEEALRLI